MEIEGVGLDNSNLNRVKVAEDGRLQVSAIERSINDQKALEQNGFGIFTGEITFTDAAEKSVLYIQNLENTEIFVTGITIGTSESTGGADNTVFVRSVGNVLPSDPILGAADGVAVNDYVGSPVTFNGVIKVSDGTTGPAVNGITGTGIRGSFVQPKEFDLGTVIPQGQALSLQVTPPASNTSMVATFSLGLYKV